MKAGSEADRLATTIGAQRATRQEAARRWLATHGDEGAQDVLGRIEHRYRIEEITASTARVHGRVVELGCFTGLLSSRILAQGATNVVGVDILDEALDLAAKRGVETVRCDLTGPLDLLPDSSFDCVVLADVLQSSLEPERLVRESHRMLVPGGLIVVTVPNLLAASNRIRALVGKEPERCDLRGFAGEHPSAFSARSLRDLLTGEGFALGPIRGDVLMLCGDSAHGSRFTSSRCLGALLPGMARNLIVDGRKRA